MERVTNHIHRAAICQSVTEVLLPLDLKPYIDYHIHPASGNDFLEPLSMFKQKLMNRIVVNRLIL